MTERMGELAKERQRAQCKQRSFPELSAGGVVGSGGADNAQRGAGQPKTGLLLSWFITYNLFSIEERKSPEMCPHENGHQLISHPGRGEPRDPSPYALFHGLV